MQEALHKQEQFFTVGGKGSETAEVMSEVEQLMSGAEAESQHQASLREEIEMLNLGKGQIFRM